MTFCFHLADSAKRMPSAYSHDMQRNIYTTRRHYYYLTIHRLCSPLQYVLLRVRQGICCVVAGEEGLTNHVGITKGVLSPPPLESSAPLDLDIIDIEDRGCLPRSCSVNYGLSWSAFTAHMAQRPHPPS